ncbi:ATP-binding cassette domain-containing protein [Goodfellowiella coeruleoviolacea]|uniref:Peptide/nickel transport system ATP-binding protein n=1 Tax=Goodfellowiella coeruleoviolacea TaxID=334858 RepID=A0AAE3GGG2_9PSEU|nr:ABC transporter ATP-binding protein [Goodfellowiella coeruleoviolacea]MCP2167791.1 peptide/nickel transport system ATP-binding protein [Goodfellowiella coeruleoviolacea]
MTALEVADLSVTFPGLHAVRGVSLRVAAGECLALVGESGSGKSVTARALLGLAQRQARVSATRLEIAGRDARAWTRRDWRRARGRLVGFVQQDALGALDPLRRIGQELAEALRLHHRLTPARLCRRSVELLESVGVPDPARRLDQYPHELSGGLRQRVLIATALAGRPAFLVADEPTTALDTTVQRQLLALLREITEAGTGVLLISHDLAAVGAVADRVAVLRDGRIVEQGPTRQVLGAPAHEYTRALLAAVPSAHAPGSRLSTAVFDLARVSPSRPPAGSGEPLVRLSGAGKVFARPDGTELVALAGVDLTVPAGAVVGVVGGSGSGKSTLARLILGLDTPDQGSVQRCGHADRRAGVQAVFQDPLGSFDPRYTVRRVLAEALAAGGVPRRQRPAHARELLAAVGLAASVLDRRPLDLSGGQRQRVAVARALAPAPALLVCDEAVSALDVSVQAQIVDLLLEVRRAWGLGVLFISHDLGVVRHVSDHVVVVHAGRVVEAGPAEQVLGAPAHEHTRQLLAAVPRLPALQAGQA